MPPDLIAGRYRVQRAVGRGGMGTVWLCRDEVLARDVALKQTGRLPDESVTDAARALREARSTAALNHKNVVSVFDVVEDQDVPWLVMEYIPSRTLGELLREEGALAPERVAGIGAQVAAGLAAAHALGIVHRDVKPGNILVGEGDLAKISDFGIARAAGDDQLTQTGLVTGTPSYFSPELARGEDPGPESDVWALGATLYAAVEGAPPYPQQRNPIAMLQTIAAELPARPVHAGFLTEPIGRMMDRNPGSRWTMPDAEHALRRLVDRDGPPHAEGATAVFAAPEPHETLLPAGVGSRPDSSPRRGMVPLLVGLAVLLLIAGAGYLMMAPGPDETPATAPENTDPSPSPSRSASPSTEPSGPSPSGPSPSGTETTQNQTPREGSNAAKVRFVETYFDTVPGNTDAGWSQLAPSMQGVGRETYDKFWGSIDSVKTNETRAVDDEPVVQVELTYSFSDGKVVTESQRIVLQDSGDGYLIADNQVLSSRTVSD